MNPRLRAHLYILLATLLIAGSFQASAMLSGLLDPVMLTLYRFVLAVLLLLPFIMFRPQRLRAVLRLLPRALVVSLFYSAYFIGMFKALETTSVLNTGTIYTLVPLMTAVLCLYFCREGIPPAQLLAYLLGIVATAIVVFRADWQAFIGLSLNHGDLIFLLASVAMAIYPIALRFLYGTDEHILVMVSSTLLGGMLWLWLFAWLSGLSADWQQISGAAFVAMLYLVIGTTILTLFLYQKGIVVIGPKKAMAYVYLTPAMVAVIAWLHDGSRLSPGVAAGILISALATLYILRQPAS